MGCFAVQRTTYYVAVEVKRLIIRQMPEVLQNSNICGQTSWRSEFRVKSGLINVKYICCSLVVLFYGYCILLRLSKLYSGGALLVCMFISRMHVDVYAR